MSTYLRGKTGIWQRSRELFQLYRFHTRNQKEAVGQMITNMREMERRIVENLGQPLRDKTILEVGPGQKQPHLHYFARQNTYTGIDIDLPILRLGPAAIRHMWRTNGPLRTLKTVGRRVLGIDSAYKKEMSRQLGSGPRPVTLQQMDAGAMTMPDNSFDCVFSISVFEHLPEPEKVMREIIRVLKPGGVAYIITHLYTSDTGVHDPAVFGEHEGIPYWAHLQEDRQHMVEANCYLNKLRLADYQNLFERLWPGAQSRNFKNDAKAQTALKQLRDEGRLAAFTDEELLTDAVETVWQKP